jgi:CRISPR-associated protein Csd1
LFKALPKEKGILDQGSALVCWTVEKEGYCPSETWKDSTIQASWIAFDMENGGQNGLCYITGEEQPLSTKHPAKIRHSGDKAKLISSNDTSGYTYRGKFLEDNQACGIGFEVSQKAHNALAWLIQRQGFRNGDQAYVAWAVSGEEIPQPTDPFSVMDDEKPKELDLGTNAAQDYAIQLRNYIAGYKAKLAPNEQIIIMGIDSATPGRMGIIYYQEKLNHEFFECLEKWHKEFAWYQRHIQEIKDDTGKKPKTKVIYPISSPVPKDIVKAAYGETVNDNLKKKTIERLLPCIVDGLAIPYDLVQSCVRKATNRVAYASDEQWLWEKNLGITCALYRGFRARLNQRRNFDMALEENYHSRDYLYGRLLAVAERIEEIALSVSGENRPTNAARLMQRFADRPAQTWLTIYKALDPYMQRLQASRTAFLNNQREELETISNAFAIEDFNNNAPLSGEFLLGYYCQRQKMKQDSAENAANYKAKQTKNTDETTSAGDTE